MLLGFINHLAAYCSYSDEWFFVLVAFPVPWAAFLVSKCPCNNGLQTFPGFRLAAYMLYDRLGLFAHLLDLG